MVSPSGKITLDNAGQFTKQLRGMIVSFLGRLTSASDVQPRSAPSPKVVTFAPNTMVFKLVQPANASPPTVVTLSGITTTDRFLLSAKAPQPPTPSTIVVSDCGKVRLNKLHHRKASLPMVVTPSGIVTEVRLEQL